jgi:hypothetical protein
MKKKFRKTFWRKRKDEFKDQGVNGKITLK